MSSAAELATLVTAARAVRGDFERAALTAGPGEDWLSWALRLAEHLGQVLDVIGQPPPVVLPANQLDCFRDMLADAETYRSKGVAGPCKDCDASPTALCWDHEADLDRIDAYKELARALGIAVRS
jgi:hypothetical protein